MRMRLIFNVSVGTEAVVADLRARRNNKLTGDNVSGKERDYPNCIRCCAAMINISTESASKCATEARIAPRQTALGESLPTHFANCVLSRRVVNTDARTQGAFRAAGRCDRSSFVTATWQSDLEATPVCKTAFFSKFIMVDVWTLRTSSRPITSFCHW